MATDTFLARITQNAGLCSGRPTIRGMRIRVIDILEMLGSGTTETDVLSEFDALEADDVRAALIFAA